MAIKKRKSNTRDSQPTLRNSRLQKKENMVGNGPGEEERSDRTEGAVLEVEGLEPVLYNPGR